MKSEKVWIVRANDPKTIGEIVVLAREDASAIDEGRVFLGKRRVTSARDAVKAGDRIRIGKRETASDVVVPILFQKDDLVAVAKPAGIPTVPDHHGASHSLVAVVARMLGKKTSDLRVTSRLDREVSGAVVFALSDAAEGRLKHARARGEYARRYVALAASSEVETRAGTWDSAIDGKESSTRFCVVDVADRVAMLAVDPMTGRTHQIRIHASGANMPLLGDREYGGPAKITLASGRIVSLARIALHAALVAVAGVEALAPIPEELERVWRELGGDASAWQRAITART